MYVPGATERGIPAESVSFRLLLCYHEGNKGRGEDRFSVCGGKNMTATILIDNQTKSDLAPEWGLAIWIEYSGHIILLDTGETGKFIENADAMKLKLVRWSLACCPMPITTMRTDWRRFSNEIRQQNFISDMAAKKIVMGENGSFPDTSAFKRIIWNNIGSNRVCRWSI